MPHALCHEFPNDNPALWRAAAMEPVVESSARVTDDDDDYARLSQLLVETALLAGATRAAALASGILSGERVAPEHRALSETALAWRAVLAGDGDLAACGDEPLDEWAALLLATLMGAPERRGDLRRELRSRGVAAFGLVARAA
jgi:hypothetical protein